MRLTDHTDYSLRVLMYLNQKKTLATLNELSEALHISKNNLIKVSNQLSKEGLIDTSRGRFGGLVIGKETGKISLRDIVKRTEENFNMAECFAAKNKTGCTFYKVCGLKIALNDALKAFMNSLEGVTLNDVTPGSGK